MHFLELIEKKKRGGQFTKSEIEFWIEGYVAGDIPDYQVSALLMAIFFNGMSKQETTDLTMTMVASGAQIDLASIEGIKVDKHSTGGVGDKVTLILVPLIASLGIPVAKMSGRGLGHTGGTIDKLESIAGFQTELTTNQFIDQVNQIGLAVIGQSEQLVKADKLLYALRDVTATVDSMPLIASSIMSKKIAAGSDAILLDVTIGSGAFMKDVENAEILARLMVELGEQVGRKTIAVITDMSEPLGLTIGNRLEILEAVAVLKNQGLPELKEFVLDLAELMQKLAGEVPNRAQLEANIANGAAYHKLVEMVVAQGGTEAALLKPAATTYQIVYSAKKSGYISRLDALLLGEIAMQLGAGRQTKADTIDNEVGIVLTKKVGAPIKEGETILTLYSNQEISQLINQQLECAVQIADYSKSNPSIIKIIESE
ncbi:MULTISPECIES: pyrimidine-nucleoside phosphorylase [unclassified Enterococcus]|uniref:pyrimidine-nucleoside phosphorylase n=1 Tax=unclassified Enterococcus TaxID=2608891 RepID=UPI001555E269|nr:MULTISPECIES: pyrimidine-nucleoside phosphorylase [unclassified Enterococcus]MBS7576139.1 pyrimidine-nucleoside phosphorylase [Enterococcus sp. MMGLQ5-2]MBS7583372.1 pyrimidine-nucleoside phosphorylase [Enterococcus sp. MMGLQ5-1]NPD11232.1 pyrimidine-nucleoside phosphorylase [Enterococcus sp. MMGLQ5-1]NPD35975.1 pyrimidine-nucleoside phosphorylase [Enterococcus sp. MMGLQ5-2]